MNGCRADDPLGGYADRLGDAGLRQNVRGYLTGSLDLVVRIPAAGVAGGLTDMPCSTTRPTGSASPTSR